MSSATFDSTKNPLFNLLQAVQNGKTQLDEYLHLFMANRGVLITPFQDMALMCPAATAKDVELHAVLFTAAVEELVSTTCRP